MKLNLRSYHWLAALSALSLTAVSSALAGTPSGKATFTSHNPLPVDWKTGTMTPVVNPAYFDDPVIRTELRPTFGYQWMADDYFTQGGEAWAIAIHVSVALNERLAFIINRGGYLSVEPGLGADSNGFFDISAGLKYVLIDDVESQFILTGGAAFQAPTGSRDILQGDQSSEFNFFLTSAKGFDDLHFTGSVNLRVPTDGDARSTILGYNLQADYRVCRYFQPFVVGSAWTTLSGGKGAPLAAEGYDVFNYGSSAAEGSTQVTVAGGFRSQLAEQIFLGVAWQTAVADPSGFFDDRLVVDLVYRF